ncbi:MAG TPA: DUF1553 domain-containing protein, partial [Bryobacteraceae bacterium]|nr:DUF1553 domain-containing protein [Bryobacteraceae bacterium]
AKRFMEEGWSLKKLHRWILLSSTYRQSSEDRPQARGVDPENKLLWKMNRQRLDYEALRDSTLFASGQLDRTMGGLPYSLTAIPSVPRRTVYAFVERGRLPGELNAFDFANPETHIAQRYLTTVPQQALYLMNSPFIAGQSKLLMARPELQTAAGDRQRVEMLYRLVFGRNPNSDEVQLGLDFIAAERSDREKKPAPEPAVWQYGMGAFEEKTGRFDFHPFTYYADEKWQPDSILPKASIGSPSLSAKGGTAGDRDIAVIRRWVAPVSGAVEISGKLVHKAGERDDGDGVRARIVHGRQGKLIEELVRNRTAEMTAHNVAVEKGDTIDFAVDGRNDSEGNAFTWKPEVRLKEMTWDAAKDFRGPEPAALNGWEKYAQVLLETNEFAFVD